MPLEILDQFDFDEVNPYDNEESEDTVYILEELINETE